METQEYKTMRAVCQERWSSTIMNAYVSLTRTVDHLADDYIHHIEGGSRPDAVSFLERLTQAENGKDYFEKAGPGLSLPLEYHKESLMRLYCATSKRAYRP